MFTPDTSGWEGCCIIKNLLCAKLKSHTVALWEFQSWLSAIKRTLKHIKTSLYIVHRERDRWLLTITKQQLLEVLPKFLLLDCSEYCYRQGSWQMRMSLKADVKGRMPRSDGIAVISILCICACMHVCVKSDPGEGICLGIFPSVWKWTLIFRSFKAFTVGMYGVLTEKHITLPVKNPTLFQPVFFCLVVFYHLFLCTLALLVLRF